MSDDLVKRLLNAPADGLGTENLCLEAVDRIEELEAKLEELLAVSKRAVRLSMDHAEFKLYAMEPMRRAIAAAELKGFANDH